jgi:hypothetical protein
MSAHHDPFVLVIQAGNSAKWTSVFGSERLTGALLDHLTHHVHILEMNGAGSRGHLTHGFQRDFCHSAGICAG